MVDVAFDGSGNLYESEFNGNVNVWPTTSATLFGKPVTAGQANTLVALNNTPAIAFDSAGDLFISNDDEARGGSISVLPATSTTIFGQSVTANTLTTLLSGLDNPQGLAFDASGNLYYATLNAVSVLPLASGTIFGHSVTADTSTSLVTGLTEGGFVALDSSGDLFYTDEGNQLSGAATVNVVPQATGTIFGQAETADTPATLVSDLTDAAGLAVDTLGDLYVDYAGTVAVISSTATTLDGTSVPANALTTLGVGLLDDLGSTYYDGSVYVADQVMESVDQLTTPSATISGVTFAGSASNPIILVTGTNLATTRSNFPIGCNGTGNDYKYGNLFLSDTTNGWGAGLPGDCIGLTVGKQKTTKVDFGLGTFYDTGFALNAGDAFTLGLDGATFNGTVSYAPGSGATVTNLSPKTGPGGGGTTVTITGTGLGATKYVYFGSSPAKHVVVQSATEVTATSPGGGGTVAVTAVTAAGGVSTAGTKDSVHVPDAYDQRHQSLQRQHRRWKDRHDHRDEPRRDQRGPVRVNRCNEFHGEFGDRDHRGVAGGERRHRARHGDHPGWNEQFRQLQVQDSAYGVGHSVGGCRARRVRCVCFVRTNLTPPGQTAGHRVRVTERSRWVNPPVVGFSAAFLNLL